MPSKRPSENSNIYTNACDGIHLGSILEIMKNRPKIRIRMYLTTASMAPNEQASNDIYSAVGTVTFVTVKTINISMKFNTNITYKN